MADLANFLPAQRERFFERDDIIVSKTDLKGNITYVNTVFTNISGFTEAELLGRPHSIIRHDTMPRCVFKLLWERITAGHEIFAYVVNSSKNGDHYWVLAHVTPSRDLRGNVIGYHSNRRVPRKDIVRDVVMPLYGQLLEAEAAHVNAKDGMNAGYALLTQILEQKGVSYDQFIWSL